MRILDLFSSSYDCSHSVLFCSFIASEWFRIDLGALVILLCNSFLRSSSSFGSSTACCSRGRLSNSCCRLSICAAIEVICPSCYLILSLYTCYSFANSSRTVCISWLTVCSYSLTAYNSFMIFYFCLWSSAVTLLNSLGLSPNPESLLSDYLNSTLSLIGIGSINLMAGFLL